MPICLLNVIAIRSLWHPIPRLWGLTRFGGNTCVRLVNRGPELAPSKLIPVSHMDIIFIQYPCREMLLSRARLKIKTVCPGMGISIIKIRRSWDSLIFIMRIPIPVRRRLCIEMAPRRPRHSKHYMKQVFTKIPQQEKVETTFMEYDSTKYLVENRYFRVTSFERKSNRQTLGKKSIENSSPLYQIYTPTAVCKHKPKSGSSTTPNTARSINC